jgi:phosphoglycolate phosphatase-like HAD superfamily hydrolase
MSLRYRCLVIDHDDTSVMSTPLIHYPAHVEALRRIRPGREPIGLSGWLEKNFDPGLMGYLRGELGMTDEELKVADSVWREHTARTAPEFFPGLLPILAEFKEEGGRLVVISHSEVRMIERDYRAAGADGAAAALGGAAKDGTASRDAMPDLIFGWDDDPDRRKPHPFPLLEAMRILGLGREEVLVLDDLKPGADMAAAVGVDFAAAGWGHSIPRIREAMLERSRYYLGGVEELRPVLMG